MGHLNGILARVGGNLNNIFHKSQMPGALPGGGGMLKLRFDRYIISMRCIYVAILFAPFGIRVLQHFYYKNFIHLIYLQLEITKG